MADATSLHPEGHEEYPLVVPVAVRVPGVQSEILLNGEPWRCRRIRVQPPLFLLTRLDQADSKVVS